MNLIKVGDLVYVKELPSCGCPHALMKVFQVTRIDNYDGVPVCTHCSKERPSVVAAWGHPNGMGLECYRLRVIPPKEELDKLILEKEKDQEREMLVTLNEQEFSE